MSEGDTSKGDATKGDPGDIVIAVHGLANSFGEQVIRASAGTGLFLPRNVVHHFRNVGTTTGTLIGVATPCGFASFVADGGVRIPDVSAAAAPTAQVFAKLAAASGRHHIELLPTWKASHAAAPRAARRTVNVFGLDIRVLLTADETRGQFCVGEITAAPGGRVPAHSHRREKMRSCSRAKIASDV